MTKKIKENHHFSVFIVGVFSWLALLWVAKLYSIGIKDQIILSGLIFLGSLILDLIIIVSSLKSTISKLFPLLNLPYKIQKSTIKLAIDFNSVTDYKPILESSIAKDSFNECKRIISACLSDSEFTVHDLVGPNQHLLDSLNSGDTFDAVSIMSDKNSWTHGNPESYLNLNIRKSNENVVIRRVFIFNTEN